MIRAKQKTGAEDELGRVERILIAAEKIFAEKTFDGTSLRDIAREADVPFSLASYHFGNKEALFEAIVERRSGVVVEDRRKLLLAARNAANPSAIPLEAIVHAYVYPFLERARSGGPQWENYTRLISHTANSRQWSTLISRYYDGIAQEFISEISRTVPAASSSQVAYGFTFLVSAMLGVAARTLRSDRLSDGLAKADDLESATKSLTAFLAGGFERLPAANP